MKLSNIQYGVWNVGIHDWEESDLDYNNAMGLALFCCENDDIGVKNFAVVACKQNGDGIFEPIWHEMVWCGGFHGYDWLYNHCISIGEIVKRDNVYICDNDNLN